jgi:hypothetical protein
MERGAAEAQRVAVGVAVVRRPSSSASHLRSSSVWISRPPPSSSWRPDGQSCGFSMTPSSVMRVELMMCRMFGSTGERCATHRRAMEPQEPTAASSGRSAR